MSNNSGIGPIQPKSGDNLLAISRPAGLRATDSAMGSKTRSQHPHVDKHYRYEDVGTDDTANVVGYTDGDPPKGTY